MDAIIVDGKVNKVNSKLIDVNKFVRANLLKGKIWVAYGDSITAGYNLVGHGTEPTDNNSVNSYVKRVADKYGMTFYNYGTSGRGYSVGGTARLPNVISSNGKVADADIVTIAMGTNDYGLVVDAGSDMPFGTLTDAPGTATFCGYTKQAIAIAQQLYDNAIFVIFTPLPRPSLLNNNYQGKNLIDYSEAIKKIAISYGCYVADILQKSRWNLELTAWKDTYLTDRLHPTQACVDKYLVDLFGDEIVKAFVNS